MLTPCNPCSCPSTPCEHCPFGYQSNETKHKAMLRWIESYLRNPESIGNTMVERYMRNHPNWREEAGLDEEEPVKEPETEDAGEPVRTEDKPFTVCDVERMDIVEFIEDIFEGLDLLTYQKDMLRAFYKLRKNEGMLVMGPGNSRPRLIMRKEE